MSHPTDELDIGLETFLADLTPAQLAHLQLGLVHAFDADLSRPDDAGGLFLLETETRKNVGIHPQCTVGDVWDIARATAEGPAPVRTAGATNILHPSRHN
jgi:hypothetical protein